MPVSGRMRLFVLKTKFIFAPTMCLVGPKISSITGSVFRRNFSKGHLKDMRESIFSQIPLPQTGGNKTILSSHAAPKALPWELDKDLPVSIPSVMTPLFTASFQSQHCYCHKPLRNSWRNLMLGRFLHFRDCVCYLIITAGQILQVYQMTNYIFWPLTLSSKIVTESYV